MTAERTNQDWIHALSSTPPDEGAVGDLRGLVEQRLRASLSGRGADAESIEDFTQDATLRVLDRIGSFRGDSRFMTWVHSIAIRVAYSELRRRRTPTQPIQELVEAAGASPIDSELAPESAELIAALRQAIDDGLTERQKTMVLAELAGAPSEAVAKHLGTNRNALYKLYYDARQKLRDALNTAGFSQEDVRQHLDRASQ